MKTETKLAGGLLLLAISLPAVVMAGPATLNHPGRTLAANCFQCHGTDGYGLEHLAGQSAREISGELLEMSLKSNPRGDIMNVHALAYTPAEIDLIADYFAKQPK
ncbi:MAG: cytochrome c class I [Thiothrix sp.]|uniref:c-type cytochrome n=1 Tax=Thiothrix sp. TaxID=1032 RepID=UPI00262ADC18|nr:cytochrome c class I [Thiothrix sp.]MDD5393947.1 cytochrome c class I [Thiothrix sp.]